MQPEPDKYQITFPHPNESTKEGLLAIGGDLSPTTLLTAYANGIFPWFSKGDPILWWSPDPRMVLFPDNFVVSDSLRRLINKKKFDVTFDQDFRSVIEACANVERKDQDETWIGSDMIEGYCDLHNLGYAHSVEAYLEGELVGGLYGVSIGKAYFGESMFYYKSDASKVAFYYLVEKIKKWGFRFIDAQVETSHLLTLGAEMIPRKDYLEILSKAMKEQGKKGNWSEL